MGTSDGHLISCLQASPFCYSRMFVTNKSISLVCTLVIVIKIFAIIACILSLIARLGVSQCLIFCSVGCSSDQRNFPISSHSSDCSTMVVTGVLAVNFGWSKITKSHYQMPVRPPTILELQWYLNKEVRQGEKGEINYYPRLSWSQERHILNAIAIYSSATDLKRYVDINFEQEDDPIDCTNDIKSENLEEDFACTQKIDKVAWETDPRTKYTKGICASGSIRIALSVIAAAVVFPVVAFLF
ncbi:MAG: hypothetical protein EZS28_032118 [Streblomastix strix]|uniref:Uncharacterized protein n=1 Tax=Streblomastix strix TaxID=222440 RepID=A0A5J4URD8_9EUKA|nr:MAG: hypothetical protein EZS28_032118 [Streblomastix strix]